MTNNTTTATRITKAQRFADIRALLENQTAPNGSTLPDLLTFVDKEIESLSKKNSKENAKRQEEKAVDQERMEAIMEYMLSLPMDDPGVNPTRLNKEVPMLYDLSTAKVSYLVTQLYKAGRLDKATKAGKTLYTVA